MKIRTTWILVKITGPILLLLLTIYLFTGYTLLNPTLIQIPNARIIHTDPLLRLTLISTTYIHVLGGTWIHIESIKTSKNIKQILKLITLTLLTAWLTATLYLEWKSKTSI